MLEIQSLSLAFGGLTVLRDVNLTARDGEVTALIGPNGAGKSALLNCICGIYPASPEARIHVDGQPIAHLPAHRRAAAGVGRTFQHSNLIPELGVRDNVMLGLAPVLGDSVASVLGRPWRARRRESERRERVQVALERFDLLAHADVPAGELPLGLQRRIDLARATVCAPRVLLLDEPASGMSRGERKAIPEWIALLQRHSRGAVIWIEHDIDLLLGVAHHVVVLHHGVVSASGRPRERPGDRRVLLDAYFGRAAA